MNRKEVFFNEATKQIRDSYVFQSEGTYSDDDVRDIATSLAEYGYQYAKKRLSEVLGFELDFNVAEFDDGVTTESLVDKIFNRMEE